MTSPPIGQRLRKTSARITSALYAPTPIGTLVLLRIAIGLLGGGDILGNGIYYHWYKEEYTDFTFRYLGFSWVHPLPEPFFSVYFVLGFLLGLAVALGWRFRITAPLFALAFTYLFLLEKAHYLNHAYLFTWLAWLLVFIPAWREFSLDVRRRPADWSPVVPAWTVFIFPALMGVVYFFGGIAKINYDWLGKAMPLHLWLRAREGKFLIGPLLAMKSTAYVMAWGGMLLDLLAPFMLLHRRWRWVALGLLLFFHATNHLIFNIGIFPYLSLVLTAMFFPPDWPRRAIRKLAGWSSGTGTKRETLGGPIENPTKQVGAGTCSEAEYSVIPVQVPGKVPDSKGRVQRWLTAWQQHIAAAPPATEAHFSRLFHRQLSPVVAPALMLIFILHFALPLRHWAIRTDVNWTEEGHRYSWRMMLRSKQGAGNFRLVDRATGAEEIVLPHDSLSPRQYRKMCTHPDMILQYAHHLRDQRAAAGQDVAIFGRFRVRLNGRLRQDYIDPDVDLARVRWSWWGEKPWVVPEERGEAQ